MDLSLVSYRKSTTNLLFSYEKKRSVKGSARSIKGFNITKALEKFNKYLERYGGHELAADLLPLRKL